MTLRRFSSRIEPLYQAFLGKRLPGAVSYDRIAGYFQSSLLELAADELRAIKRVRIVCNTAVNPAPARRAGRANQTFEPIFPPERAIKEWIPR